MIVILYLSAIVIANLLVAQFGPAVTIVNAFLFIGLDITARDALHERWQRRQLWLKMAILIGAGSILSAALNWQARNIALASFAAFAGSGLIDTLVYQLLHDRTMLVKINGSNLLSAAVDSVVFPALAFGFPLLPGIMAGQFVAKALGGFVWSVTLRGFHANTVAEHE